ncbi:MAG: hypothetical protein ABIW49_12490 [Knoellia sp.]
MSVTRTQKVLVPLATLLVAGAIAVGSGATFSSTTGNTISAVTSGSLLHTNSKDGAAVFNLTNVKPGDTLNGTLTIKNTGSLPAAFGLTETASANAFGDGLLKLVVTNVTTGTQVYSGNFGGLVDGTKTSLGEIAPAASNEFRFTVTLDQDATNTEQGKTASATYAWDSVQLAGTTTNQ